MKILIILLCLLFTGCAWAKEASDPAPTQVQIETREEQWVERTDCGSLYFNDPSLPEGVEELLFEGQPGQVLQKGLVTYENGKKTRWQVFQEEVLVEPIKQIVAVGTGEASEKERAYPLIGENLLLTEEGKMLEFSHQGQFKATAYTAGEPGVKGTTATGTQARVGAIAVDPKVIPYGTKLFILSEDGKYVYGEATAEDCGGLIKGNRIDLYFDTLAECNTFGVRMCQVYFLI